MTTDGAKRRYESPLRAAQAEQTRALVLKAATQLFEERAWNGTGMREVAQAAGVSIETVYSNFGSKAELLRQALDVAVVGDTAAIPLADRTEFRELHDGTASDRVQVATKILVAVRQRTAGLRGVLNQAASGDPQLSALLSEVFASERESVRQAAVLVAQRDVSDEDVDALFGILSTEVFLLLTETRGWQISTYQAWAARMIRAVLNLEGDPDGS